MKLPFLIFSRVMVLFIIAAAITLILGVADEELKKYESKKGGEK